MKNPMTSFRSRREQGNALVLVISFIFIIGMIIALLVAIVIDANGKATSTRANAQAVAAAEGGVDLYLQHLLAMEGACYAPGSGTYGSETADVEYKVLATQYKTSAGSSWKDCGGGQFLDYRDISSLMIKVSGRADDKTRSRESANEATVERVLAMPKPSIFQDAIYGDQGVKHNTQMKISSDDKIENSSVPDVVTSKVWNCSSKSDIGGSVIALGGLAVSDMDCRIRGDLYVGTSAVLGGGGLTVDGDVYINGDLTVSNTVKFSGDLLIAGKLSSSNKLNVAGETRIYETFYVNDANALSTMSGNVYVGKGLEKPNDYNSKETLKTWDSKSPVGLYLNQPTTGAKWKLPAVLTDEEEQANRLTFPRLTAFDPLFDGYQVMSRQSFNSAMGRGVSDCNGNYYGTLDIAVDTIIDMSDCDWNISNANMTFNISADVVIQVRSMKMGGILAFVNKSPDVRHSVYIVAAPKSPWAECLATSPHKIDFVWGEFNLGERKNGTVPQDERGKIKTLLYAAGNVNLNSTKLDSYYGQMYGCTVTAPPVQEFIFAKVGADITNSPADLKTRWVRDITN